MTIAEFLKKRTPKYQYLQKFFGKNEFRLLDVGSANHSASKTKQLFPNCEYHGIDLQKDFYNDEADYAAMSGFYEMDLTHLKFDEIPNDYFDFIRMTHVIEHLHNGDKVIEGLIGKLKADGYIYIEYPGIKSTKLPSMSGTLNFYDDGTHVRIYSVEEVAKLLGRNGLGVLKSGTRRNSVFLMAMPFRVARSILTGGKLKGNMFWDFLGFAEFVLARKGPP